MSAFFSFAPLAFGEDAPKPGSSPTPASTAAPVAQKVDVDALKNKYWAKGDEQALEVVQNRIYTKSHKITIEGDAGTVGGDPFQTTNSYGGLLGFYFNEYFGIDVLYWKMKSSHNAAYQAFVDAAKFGANSNALDSLIGGEVTASLLYGKLSLVGKAILHFDLTARAGLGKLTLTGFPETDQPAQHQTVIAPWIGLGQQLYITHWLSFHLDWRMMFYRQNIVEQFQPDSIGTVIGEPSMVTSNIVTAGLSFLLF